MGVNHKKRKKPIFVCFKDENQKLNGNSISEALHLKGIRGNNICQKWEKEEDLYLRKKELVRYYLRAFKAAWRYCLILDAWICGGLGAWHWYSSNAVQPREGNGEVNVRSEALVTMVDGTKEHNYGEAGRLAWKRLTIHVRGNR